MGNVPSAAPAAPVDWTSIFLEDTKLVNEFLHHIAQVGYGVDFCEVSGRLSDLRPLPHESKSDAMVLFASVLDRLGQHKIPVAVKAFLDPAATGGENGTEVEALIYSKLVAPMLARKMTPNVVGFLAYVKCTQVVDRILAELPDTRAKTLFRQNLVRLQKEWGAASKGLKDLNILITEKATNATPLGTLLEKNDPGVEAFSSLAFQILFTLEVFNRFDLRHNDLHPWNIFVQEGEVFPGSSNSVCMEYVLTDEAGNTVRKFYIPTKHLALIFDFDRGSCPALPHNTSLDNFLCRDYGQCNGINHFCDTFKFLLSMAVGGLPGGSDGAVCEPIVEHTVSKELILLQRKMGDDDEFMLRKPPAWVLQLLTADRKKVLQATEDLVKRNDERLAVELVAFHRNPRPFMREHGGEGYIAQKPENDQLNEFWKWYSSSSGPWVSMGEMIPPPYPEPFWMLSTFDILSFDNNFATRFGQPNGRTVIATYTMPSRRETDRILREVRSSVGGGGAGSKRGVAEGAREAAAEVEVLGYPMELPAPTTTTTTFKRRRQ